MLILIDIRFHLGFVEKVANVKQKLRIQTDRWKKRLNADKPTEGCQTKSNHNSSHNSSYYLLALMSKYFTRISGSGELI